VTFLRLALEADRAELARFECASPQRSHELEVEAFVRSALDWLEEPDGVDREVLVLEEDGQILAVVMHEDDDGDRFVNALAVRTDHQCRGLGRQVLAALLFDLSSRYAGSVAIWRVAPANFASHKVSDAVGAVASYPPDVKPFALYAISLVES
jgi:hypothetical protein